MISLYMFRNTHLCNETKNRLGCSRNKTKDKWNKTKNEKQYILCYGASIGVLNLPLKNKVNDLHFKLEDIEYIWSTSIFKKLLIVKIIVYCWIHFEKWNAV